MTTSYLLWNYRETVDVSKSLRLAFDQGAFKDMNLIVKWPVTSYCINLLEIARHNQGADQILLMHFFKM